MSHWGNYLLGLSFDAAVIIRPELTQATANTVYILDSQQCGLEFDGEVLGATSPGMAIWLRSAIGKNWQGNCPAMMINSEYCKYLAGDFKPNATSIANAVACHELTHIVQYPGLFSKQHRGQSRQRFDRSIFVSDVQVPDLEHSRNSHDQHFIRLMLHIAERMRRRGRCVNELGLLDWEFHGTPRPMLLEKALWAEIDGLSHVPLSAVATLPLPKSYLELWNQES